MGDGSYQIKIRKKLLASTGEKDRKEIALNFQIDQKTDYILKEVQNIFGGSVGHRVKTDTYYYGSGGFGAAYKVIKYFDMFSLQSTKYLNYLYFRKTYLLIQDKKHLTEEGLEKIEHYKNSMNSKLILPHEYQVNLEDNNNRENDK